MVVGIALARRTGEEALSVSPRGVRLVRSAAAEKAGRPVGSDGLCTFACLRYPISIYQPWFRFGSLTFTLIEAS